MLVRPGPTNWDLMAKTKDRINPRLPTSIPQQLKDILIRRITTNEHIPGERIGSERMLAQEFGISRISARQALTELIAETYLFRIPGKGTFVERADRIARKLKRDSFTVGFLVGQNWYSFARPGISKILEGVERALRKRGYQLLFRTWDESNPLRDWNSTANKLPHSELQGYILVGPVQQELVQQLTDVKAPFILLDSPTPVAGVNRVAMDTRDAARQAIRYFVKLGHTEIGYIGPKQSNKYLGYREELKDSRVSVNDAYVEFITVAEDGHPSFQHGKDAMSRMIQRNSLPTAIFATNDIVALGIMEVLKTAQLSVPGNISLVGCDDLDIYGQADPPLSTVCTDLEEFGAFSVQRLFSLMENPRQKPIESLAKLQLLIRGSAQPKITNAPPSLQRQKVSSA
jgi:DNA-binding LacI/PurR family transcriptional regulator